MVQSHDGKIACQVIHSMEIAKKRQIKDILLCFYLLSHPVPVSLHIVSVTVSTLLATWPHFTWSIIELVIAAHAAMQVSIAMLNDYCDRRVDAESKPGKPIPRDLVHPGEALIAGIIVILIMLVLLTQLPCETRQGQDD